MNETTKETAVKAPLAPQVQDGLAVASFVLSLVWIGGIGAVLAVIFGLKSLRASRKVHREASTLALFGIVIGYVGIAAMVALGFVLMYVLLQSPPAPCDYTNPNFPNC